MLKQFKFFNTIKKSARVRNLHQCATFNSFSYPDSTAFSGEMNYLFIWSTNDLRTNEYREGIYQGYIKDFANTYDNVIIENNEMLYLFPTIQSISLMRDYINVPVGTSYMFNDPDEFVTIFYKIYTRD